MQCCQLCFILYKVVLTFEPVDETLKAFLDLSHDVTQNCDFLCFSLKQKFIYTNRFIVSNLVNL